MSLKVIIIEDELPARSELIRKLDLIDPTIYIIDEIISVKQGIEKLPHIYADLIFCDVRLSDGLSFEIFEDVDCEIPVVFTTAYDEYAIKAFQVNSIGYLVKPIVLSDLKFVLEKYKKSTLNYSMPIRKLYYEMGNNDSFIRSILVKKGDRIIPIKIEDVAYFFAQGKYVFLTTWNGEQYLTEFSLQQLKDKLDPKEFYQLNRQYIVHLNAIESLVSLPKSKLQIILSPNTKGEVVVSSEKSVDFKKWLKVYVV